MHLANNIYMTDELRAIADQVITFCQNEVAPHAEEWEEAGDIPRHVLTKMGDLGMFSLRVPESEGGLGMGPIASCVLGEALGRGSTLGGFDATVTVHTDMASPHLIHKGTEEQLAKYVPGVMSGEILTAIAVTEPDAGSDVAGLRTTAVRDGEGWRLNGTKMFITNGGTADLVIVAARTNPDTKYGISMFLLDKGTPGFSVSRKLEKHGWLSSNTVELVLDDVYLPAEALLGEEHKGFYEIMKNFQNERLVLTAVACGAAQTAIDMTLEYTQNRKAFDGVIYDKGAVRQRMAMNQAKLDATRAALYHAAWMYENGEDATKEVSAVKAFGCEAVNEIMYDCTQFHGGMGYMRETTVERMYRDARINTIGGGATEVLLEEVARRSYM
jgi:acyl-CoA dehydrogenase